MNRLARSATYGLAVAMLLLSACSAGGAEEDPDDLARWDARPTRTSPAPPSEASRLADRYRNSGGTKDVYGIRRTYVADNVPLLTVWTHNRDDSAEVFDPLKDSITYFLQAKEGIPLKRGYVMDVYGPDGSLQHRMDARM
ncbi:hypothetical protein [Streptomyces sp. ODS28]|uniref:hypothetical protein n=1 Tax=Streptomyces sp. ODS28 TaxID=3136688 RepID=UPI0031E558CB